VLAKSRLLLDSLKMGNNNNNKTLLPKNCVQIMVVTKYNR
jgi:hypothetical protein